MSTPNQLPSRTTASILPPPWLYKLADNTLWLLLLASPLLLFPHGRWPWLGLTLVLTGWLMRIVTGKPFFYTGLEPSLALVASMAALGWLISIEPSLSAPRFWSLILGLMAFFEFSQISLSPRLARRLTILLLLAASGVACLTLVGGDWDSTRLINAYNFYQYLPRLIHGLPDSGITTNDLINLRWLGITLGFLIPVPLVVFLWDQNSRLRVIAGITASSALVMLLLTQSVQGVFGLAAGVFFLLAWRWRWVLWTCLAFTLIFGLLLLIAQPWAWIIPMLSLDTYTGIGVSLRMDIWSRGWAMLKDMPLTGVGLNTFPLQIRYFYPGFAIGDEPHAHQLYLQTALDLGLPGLLAFLGAQVLWFRRLYENFLLTKDQMVRVLYLGLAAGVISYLAHGFLDAMMLGAKPGVFLWVMLGIGVAKPLMGKAEPHRLVTQSRWISFTPYLVLLLILAFIAIFRPATVEINIATIKAHRFLTQEPLHGDESLLSQDATLESLQRLASLFPEIRSAHDLAGRLLLWQGDSSVAVQYFNKVVSLDQTNPYKQFYPPAFLTRRLPGQDQSINQSLQDLAAIYNRWTMRYPTRAEYVLLEAILYDQFLGNPEQAMRVLERGIAYPSLPRGALEYYRDQISVRIGSLIN